MNLRNLIIVLAVAAIVGFLLDERKRRIAG